MSDPQKPFWRIFTERGPLLALTVAMALLVGIAGPASAQFFNFGGFGAPPRPPQAVPQPRGGGWFGNDFFPFRQEAPKRAPVREDFSKAPPPEKRDASAPPPERNILVLGDAMADWLGYGLEDAYSEQPDMGVIRKHKTVSGLIKYQPRGEAADWTAAAKAILATEKPDAIVAMLGMHDRVAIREAITEKKTEKKDDKKDARGKTDAKPGDNKTADGKPADAKPADPKAKPEGPPDPPKRDYKPVDAELSPDDAADNDTPQTSAPEKSARSSGGLYEFRDER